MTQSSASVFVGLLAVSVAIACTTGTNAPTASGSAAITNRTAENALYDSTRKGSHKEVAAYFTDPTVKVVVTDFVDDVHPKVASLNTKAAADDEGEVDVDGSEMVSVGGKPAHGVEFHERDYPPMGDRDDQIDIIDKGSNHKVTFTADHDFFRYSADDGSEKLSVIMNPDGTFTVNGKPAKTIDEAANLVEATNLCQRLSLEALGSLYAGLIKRERFIETLCGGGATGLAPADPVPLLKEIIMDREKTEL